MDRTLSNALRQLGCTEKHIRLYMAALRHGPEVLPDLAKHARLQRSTAYLIADELVALGLLQEDYKTYRKTYSAAEPAVLLRKLEAEHRKLGRLNLAFREILPDLQAAQQATSRRPRVRTYEGMGGLVAVWKDILQEKSEVLLWTNQAAERNIFSVQAHGQFIAERIQKGIRVRALAIDNFEGRELMAGDAGNLRETRLLPPGVTFSSEVYIYGNKVAVLDVGKQVFGVITENPQIAATHRAIFEMAWSLGSAAAVAV